MAKNVIVLLAFLAVIILSEAVPKKKEVINDVNAHFQYRQEVQLCILFMYIANAIQAGLWLRVDHPFQTLGGATGDEPFLQCLPYLIFKSHFAVSVRYNQLNINSCTFSWPKPLGLIHYVYKLRRVLRTNISLRLRVIVMQKPEN